MPIICTVATVKVRRTEQPVAAYSSIRESNAINSSMDIKRIVAAEFIQIDIHMMTSTRTVADKRHTMAMATHSKSLLSCQLMDSARPTMATLLYQSMAIHTLMSMQIETTKAVGQYCQSVNVSNSIPNQINFARL